jgi:MFS family permease
MQVQLSEENRVQAVRRNTALLAVAQASAWLTIAVFVAAAPLAVVRTSGHTSLGGFVFALWSVSLAVGAQIAGLVMDRFGRRPGLAAGHLLFALASLASSVAVLRGSTIGLLAAAVIGGAGSGGALLGRAAVADMYPPQRRGVAIGFMLAAGTVGAILGPQVVQLTRLLAASSGLPQQLSEAWWIAAANSGVALVCCLLLRPDPRQLAPAQRLGAAQPARPLATLLRMPALRGAMSTAAFAQFAMTGLMSIYAIAVSAHGVAISLIALILSAHFSGMFAFSPVWGIFLDRVGRREGLLAGAALVVAGALIVGLPIAFVSAVGLFLIGLGWSGSYLGATAVVSDMTTPVERGTALGFTDLLSAGAAAAGSLTSGVLLDSSGFMTAGLASAVILVLAFLVVLLVPRSSWRPAAAPAA